ncbi:MAG TPA: polysaccharide biosynthesis protein [Desulfuromonadales bacterium]|nr:polysaccharide biosynthesis protein [Desulfuromonadales bacterium]
MFTSRRVLVYFLDLFLIMESYLLAQVLDRDFSFALFTPQYLLNVVLVVVIAQALVFVTSPMYRNIWAYASIYDMVEIIKTVSIACIVSGLALFFFQQRVHFSRVVFLLDWGLLLAQVAGSRLCWRIYRERHSVARGIFSTTTATATATATASGRAARRTLIVGAGDAGDMLLREMNKQRTSPYRIIGFIDDSPDKQHMRLHGIEVLGTTCQLPEVIAAHAIEKVIIAVPSAGAAFVRGLVNRCQEAGAKVKIIPGLSEIISGNVKVTHIRDVAIEDLLGRMSVSLDDASIRHYLHGMRVLVSGAAGSIGSEICRQVATYEPAMLVLLDSAETPLFFIEQELTARFPALRIVAILCDVRTQKRLDQVFSEILPEVVFHAAAYKHVPLVEQNQAEAVLCNVLGSMNMATASQQYGVRNFVMISSDKAVNPTNVMGTTKRVAEKYIQALSEGSRTKFSTVRFGNVLGSNGSVIPIFMEQIRAGGPLTITHPEITRFFMTIPEASQLVLQSACFGEGGEIFVLDMGEPVRIVELAEELVRLSGFTPHTDIEFVYTGLRPGEKLYEELFFRGENVLSTPHEKIHVMSPVHQDYEQLCDLLRRLLSAASDNDTVTLIALLQELVPEYTPTPNS